MREFRGWVFPNCEWCDKEFEVKKSTVAKGGGRLCPSCRAIESQGKRGFQMTGASQSRLGAIWASMVARCQNPNSTAYKDYGAKGVKICDEWLTFYIFKDWAEANGYSAELSRDRVNPYGNYEPANCRWADVDTQANNKRHHHKESAGSALQANRKKYTKKCLSCDEMFQGIKQAKYCGNTCSVRDSRKRAKDGRARCSALT